MLKSILSIFCIKVLLLFACFLLSSNLLIAQSQEITRYANALEYYKNKEYTKALDTLNSLNSDSVLDIHIDYFKVLSSYHLWRADNTSTTLWLRAKIPTEKYLEKHNDNIIDYYNDVVNVLNELKQGKGMDITSKPIPIPGRYIEALKFVTALEYYQNKDYLKAYELFKSVKTEQKIDYQTDYYELMSLYYMYREMPSTKNWKTELQKKTSDFLTKYSAENKYYDPDIHSKISSIHKSVSPLAKKLSYLALGYEGGLIAPYGIRFEYMSKGGLGLFINGRTSLANDQDILNEKVIANKNEVIVGPLVRLVDPWLNLNLGVGIGYYNAVYRNDYATILDVRRTNYLATYGGITLKLGRIGLSGGLSFMDIGEALYKPEPTLGLTYQIK